MTSDQRRVIAGGCFAIAGILFIVFFMRPFWSWISWNEAKNTIDLGIVKFSNRPPFPNDARAVFLGLIGPVVLVTIGRVFSSKSST
jgi:NhaP-type Na+/H+ or K+/H+ antiporter